MAHTLGLGCPLCTMWRDTSFIVSWELSLVNWKKWYRFIILYREIYRLEVLHDREWSFNSFWYTVYHFVNFWVEKCYINGWTQQRKQTRSCIQNLKLLAVASVGAVWSLLRPMKWVSSLAWPGSGLWGLPIRHYVLSKASCWNQVHMESHSTTHWSQHDSQFGKHWMNK